ncbi:crossover junction endonuclease EME1 [Triticum dicoccoides]|uniref:crossover junction endonuclease EME1 n=1 Tax=Triticum dicoccoides TaxID=85692 RepID=UPI00188DEB69|nr:crossover junction endonuclease EME1 [Triticum dicoccoides]
MEENAPPIKERKGQKRLNKEEKDKMIEEKKRQREEKRLQKEANKIQQAEKKKSAKEKAEWASRKRALESIVAKIDSKVIETGSIGGALLTMFSEKKLSYQVERNPMRGSILWKMVSPNDQEPALEPYILFVLQAEEFCDLISSGKFLDHVLKARSLYPTFTICYVTHKLMKYIYDREQSQYKNSDSSNRWKRPPVEQVLCKLVTHYDRVHSKDCADEDQLAEHVVRLTTSLAKCKFRKQLSWLSVQTNGVIVPNDFVNKDQLKKDTWFMSLLAIPKVKPRLALAIWKKYGTMRSLLNVYMDPNKSNREKELLLKDLKYEDSLGEESKKVGPVYSRRVYRMLMAENGAMEAEEAVKS